MEKGPLPGMMGALMKATGHKTKFKGTGHINGAMIDHIQVNG